MNTTEKGKRARFQGSESIGACDVIVLKEFQNICEVIPEKTTPHKWPYSQRRTFNVSPSELH